MGSALAQGSSPNAMKQSFLFHGATLEGKQRGSRQPGGKWQKSKYHDKPAQQDERGQERHCVRPLHADIWGVKKPFL